jgi:two-component system, OmpR family, phosphate regulon sensor histidine kinase PhoR
MKAKNALTITLMISSIVLLLTLQVLWMRSEYENSVENFRKEANSIFRTVVNAMQDSLIDKSIRPIDGDSTIVKRIYKNKLHADSVFVFTTADTTRRGIIRERSSSIQLFVNSAVKKDSINKFVRPLLSRIDEEMPAGQRFVIRLSPDTLRVDSIKQKYVRALGDAGISVSPKIVRLNPEARFQRNDSLVSTFPVRVHPGQAYVAQFSSIDTFIWEKLTPQALFSVFLTLLTIISFVVMFRSLRTQQRLMELKNDFISNVTHELKTPVSTVSVALEALKNFHGLDNPERTKEYLEIAQSELNRLTLMTDKILKASAFENGDIAFTKENVDLKKTTQQILDSMKLLFEKTNAKVSFQTDGNNFIAEGEATHITNVIYNLVDNALKYSPENPEIKIVLKDFADRVILSVQDNGIGIPSEYKNKVFEKFFRVPTGDIHNIKGYGLGLSYVSSVMKAHDGTVEVESEPGKGSNFIVTFPQPV